jgi:mannose-1-phosphate guanylyltransferase/mannose-1-phosphate guanylyltransferase/mannose-6-phosphate isomerase
MTKATITPVVLTGGSGTRLWPLSRAARPKQFLSLIGEKSMLEETLARVKADRFAPPLLVGAESQADLLEALAVDDARIILEPIARNTAPAIALAALSVSPDTQLLVMPSDHVITDNQAFESAITKASELAAEGWLVTFGIAPGGPETGYGYIREGEALGAWGYRVESFVEKPDEDTAQAFLDTGGYHWNGGIFLFTAGAFLTSLRAHAPEIASQCEQAMTAAKRDARLVRPEQDSFAAAPAISIDYAVMEQEERVAVVPVAMGWSDIGSWDALHALIEKDENGNGFWGDIVAVDTGNSLVRSDGPLVATIGVEDLIVVATADAVLIARKGQSQRVKEVVEALKASPDGEKKV